MKLRKRVTRTEQVDVVETGRLRIMMAGRIRRGFKSPCGICGDEITDDFALGIFSEGHPNTLIHEACDAN